jgi:Ca-activated chloride channel family protein
MTGWFSKGYVCLAVGCGLLLLGCEAQRTPPTARPKAARGEATSEARVDPGQHLTKEGNAARAEAAPQATAPQAANPRGLMAPGEPSSVGGIGGGDGNSLGDLRESAIGVAGSPPSGRAAARRKFESAGSMGQTGRVLGGLGMGGAYRMGGGYGIGAGFAAEPNREGYEHVRESEFQDVRDHALSTFSSDVDTASYANVRRFLKEGLLPPIDAVRIEEMINYFDYGYAAPGGGEPFAVHTELTTCPWNAANQLLRVGIQARRVNAERTPPRNLVFLVDVSGSMSSIDKLPLLQRGLGMLTGQLRAQDRVSIVVYAGAAGAVLEPTRGDARDRIRSAIENLRAGGSTNGAAGIQLAYELARRNYMKEGVNRVILATDGDFNVGVSSQGDLVRLIERQRESGVFLTVLGFGTGNVQDHLMESLADNGNGNYAYIDSEQEAEKVLVRESGSTLVTIAKDVKLQIEFNPRQVKSYRLVGYENRALKDEEFNDDKKDAGDIGAGHNVTALYEIVPVDGNADAKPSPDERATVDPLRYQTERGLTETAPAKELATVKIRYKRPAGSESVLLSRTVDAGAKPVADASASTRFAAAVAMVGMLLRASKHSGTASAGAARALAKSALGSDPHGDRAEFLALLDRAATTARWAMTE